MGRIAKRFLVPIVVSVVMAILTLNFEYLPVKSESSFWSGVQDCVVLLLFAGVFGAMMLARNVHAYSLWLAAMLNGLIYFGVARALTWALTGLAKERKWRLPHFR